MPASQAGRRRFESGRPLSQAGPQSRAGLAFSPERRHFLGMRAVTPVALAAALSSGLGDPPLAAQGRFAPPQPPCELPAGHFKVNGGILYLRTAAEKPAQRDAQLAQARKVLTEAILENQQDK